MVIKFNLDDDYELWVEKMCSYERIRALKKISNGYNVNEVIEEFSNRVTKKMLHPILIAIRSSHNNYDVEQGKEAYYNKMNKRGPVADHILDDNDI
jgi:glutamyl-tRNA reductase